MQRSSIDALRVWHRVWPLITKYRETSPVAFTTDEEHAAKMRKVKVAQNRKVAAKTIEKGLIIVHTGAGKGTTILVASLGLDGAMSALSPAVKAEQATAVSIVGSFVRSCGRALVRCRDRWHADPHQRARRSTLQTRSEVKTGGQRRSWSTV